MSTADAPDDAATGRVGEALNALCGPEIAVRSCVAVPDEFHARFAALSRTYVYAILAASAPDPWLARTSLWHAGDLDLDAMNEAAGHLVGAHDFRSFGRVDPEASSERVVYELECLRHGSVIRIRARANAFIHQMVRSITGTLIQVGEGGRSPDEMPGILEGRDRAAAGPVAPPHGLCLVAVEYEDGWATPFDPFK
jgi:tRNA pseudouridine38-40 synthase